MPLSIRNPEVDRLARELAAATGQSVTEAIRTAVVHELDRVRTSAHAEQARRVEAIMAIGQRCAALPVLDDRPEDDILGYDAQGIPTR